MKKLSLAASKGQTGEATLLFSNSGLSRKGDFTSMVHYSLVPKGQAELWMQLDL